MKAASMSDDEADPELLALLRKSLGLGGGAANPRAAETKILENAQFIFDNAIDVALNSGKTKEAAEMIWRAMQKKNYSTHTWSEHELHPKAKDESTVDFIFTMDLLNFSFWSDEPDEEKRFTVDYRGKRWTGYWSLVAALQRALDEGIPITDAEYWVDEETCTDDVLRNVFRSATDEEMPLLQERIQCLREAGRVLCKDFDGHFANCIYSAHQSAASLINLLAENFPCFRDETTFQGRRVRLYKRAQILVADLWACFNGESYGAFEDIDKVTMFAGMLTAFLSINQVTNCISQTIEFLKFSTNSAASCTPHHWKATSVASGPSTAAPTGKLNSAASASGASSLSSARSKNDIQKLNLRDNIPTAQQQRQHQHQNQQTRAPSKTRRNARRRNTQSRRACMSLMFPGLMPF